MKKIMKLYKRENGIYYVRAPGNKRISLGTKNKQVAETLFRKLRKEYLERKLYILDKNKYISLSQAVKDFLEYQESINEYSTVERYKITFDIFLSTINKDQSIREIAQKDLEKFFAMRQKKVSSATVGIDFRNLRAFFNYCIKNKYIVESPLTNIKIKQEKKLPAFLSGEEITKLFKFFNETNNELYEVLFALYIYTGRRRNEILNLTLNDIDMKNNKLRYYNQKKKIHNIIPIIEPLRKILYPYIKKNKFKINANPEKKIFCITPNTVTHRFKEYFRKILKREDINVHALRHTFASNLIMQGAPLKALQELLDHADIKTTLIYTHLTEEYRKNIIELLNY